MKPIFLFVFLFFATSNSIAQSINDLGKTQTKQKMQNPSGQKGLTIYPARLSFNLDKGQSGSQIINIGNFTDKKYQFVTDFRDWTRDSLGNHAYITNGEFKQSCADWITFDKSIIELGPNESAALTVTMKVPDNNEAISEMKWTMLVVKTAVEKHPPIAGVRLAAQIDEVYGIGVHILQTPPNITNKELKMLSFDEVSKDSAIYRVTCKNVGGVELTAKFSLELSSTETGKKTTVAPKPIPLFPQQIRIVDFTLPSDLPKGKYTAIALIDADDDSVPIEAAEKEITVK